LGAGRRSCAAEGPRDELTACVQPDNTSAPRSIVKLRRVCIDIISLPLPDLIVM
jgi:hypothetical protein